MLSRPTNAAAQGMAPHSSAAVRAMPVWLTRIAGPRAYVALIGFIAACLLPEFSISSRLPNIRPEQILLPYALFTTWLDHRSGRPFRVGRLDLCFAALAASTLVSIFGAPLILHIRLSPRDFYEPVKLVLYYALFRLARDSFSRGRSKTQLIDLLLVSGGASAAFGLFQYFDWLHVNVWLTPRFAPDHHLDVLRQSGRVVGTIGNPNYFGIFCAILALASLLCFWLRRPPPVPPAGRVAIRLLGLSVVGALASLGIVMSGSRTALLALAVSTAALLLAAIVRGRSVGHRPRLFAGAAILSLLLLAAVAFVEAFPRGQVDYLGRVGDGLAVGDDASLGLRLARWRGMIDAWLPRGVSSSTISHTQLTSVHATGVPPASAEIQARDAQRKADLLRLATAVDATHRALGRWPAPDVLAAELVPRFLAAVPVDPSTGQPYPLIPSVTGYSVMTKLEDQSDPDYPVYGIGSSPNYLLNGNLERGGGRPSNWDAIPGSVIALQRGDALYGDKLVLFRGESARPQQRAGVFQQRYFGRPGGNPFTATVWLKLPEAQPGQLALYANVIFADGTRADPLTRIPADMSKIGVWQKVSLGILPPRDKTFAYMGIYVVSDGYQGTALLDGFQLVDGPVPLSFTITREAPPSDTLGFNPEARLRRSPLIGVGPEKGEQGSSLDDEYLLYAARYGLLGITLYLALYLGTLVAAVRAFVASQSTSRVLAGLVALTIVAFLVFNVTAGSFYELQLMAIFWLLTGAALAPADEPTDG